MLHTNDCDPVHIHAETNSRATWQLWRTWFFYVASRWWARQTGLKFLWVCCEVFVSLTRGSVGSLAWSHRVRRSRRAMGGAEKRLRESLAIKGGPGCAYHNEHPGAGLLFPGSGSVRLSEWVERAFLCRCVKQSIVSKIRHHPSTGI